MSAIELKSSIMHILDETKDEEVLEAYYHILLHLLRVQGRAVVGYDAEGEALTGDDLRQKVKKASARIEAGKVVKHDEAKKQAKNW